MTRAVIDLKDVTSCPCGHRCESCGAEHAEVAVGTATTRLGVLCLTLCPRCAAADCSPPVALATAERLVLQHAGHLGIDVDEMAAVMSARP